MGKRDTMTITLDPKIEAPLREKAKREGQEPNDVANTLLAEVLMAEAREQEKITVGLREAMNLGPGKPLEQYLAEQRVKHGYPDTWPRRDLVKEIAPGVFVDNQQDENSR